MSDILIKLKEKKYSLRNWTQAPAHSSIALSHHTDHLDSLFVHRQNLWIWISLTKCKQMPVWPESRLPKVYTSGSGHTGICLHLASEIQIHTGCLFEYGN